MFKMLSLKHGSGFLCMATKTCSFKQNIHDGSKRSGIYLINQICISNTKQAVVLLLLILEILNVIQCLSDKTDSGISYLSVHLR